MMTPKTRDPRLFTALLVALFAAVLGIVAPVAQTVIDTHLGKVRIVSTAPDALCVGANTVSPASTDCVGGVYAGAGVFSSVTANGVVVTGPPKIVWFSTTFENLTRLNAMSFASGVAPTVTTLGMQTDTSAAGAGSSGTSSYFATLTSLQAGWAVFGSFTISTKGTDAKIYVGNTTDAMMVLGGADNFNLKHFGFKVVWAASGNGTLSATNANGTTETATALDAGIVVNDQLTVLAKVNTAATGIDYYYRKNGGAWSSVTTHTTNLPSTAPGRAFECAVGDHVTSQTIVAFHAGGMGYAE